MIGPDRLASCAHPFIMVPHLVPHLPLPSFLPAVKLLTCPVAGESKVFHHWSLHVWTNFFSCRLRWQWCPPTARARHSLSSFCRSIYLCYQSVHNDSALDPSILSFVRPPNMLYLCELLGECETFALSNVFFRVCVGFCAVLKIVIYIYM